MESTLKKTLIPVLIVFLICLSATFIFFLIFNWDWAKEIFYWFIRTTEKWGYEFIIKILSIIILFFSFYLYHKFLSKKLKDATNEEVLKVFNINYTETYKDNYIYLDIKKDLNYWLECIEKLAVLIAMVSIYLASSRFFSTETPLNGVISTISLLLLPIALVFIYAHYALKLMMSLIWAKYSPLKNNTESASSERKATSDKKIISICILLKQKATWCALGYIVIASFLSVVLIFYFPITLGIQMAPVKPELITYCQIKDLPPNGQSWCQKQKDNTKK